MLLLNAACCPCQCDGAEEKRREDARAAKHSRTMPRILLSGSRWEQTFRQSYTSKTHFWSFLNYPLLSLSQINEQKRDDTAGTYYQPLLWYITLFTIKLYSPLKILFPCQRMRSNILLFKSLVSWNGGRHQLVRQHPASQLRRVLPSAYWRCAERGCTLMHPDMEFVQNFTPLDFQAKICTPSISPNFKGFIDKNIARIANAVQVTIWL